MQGGIAGGGSLQNTIDLKFADGEYTFALPLPQIAELQRKTGIGIGGLLQRVMKGCSVVGDQIFGNPMLAEFYALDLIETIRHGLIGGAKGVVNGEEVKVTPVLAGKLLEAYVLSQPLAESWNIAAAVLGATVMGFDPPKKEQPAAERAEADQTTEPSITPEP